MEHAPALYALQRLHADLGGQIKQNQAEATRLRENMLHVEAVIKMLDPAFNVHAIAARRRNNGNPVFKRGDVWRTAVVVLRDALTAMTAREIAVAMLSSKGVKDAPTKQVRDLTAGVMSSLRNHRGSTVETVGEGLPHRWKVVPL